MGKQAGHHSMKQDEINAVLVELALSGLTVVRLKGGDPFVFGRGGEEIQALEARGIPYETVPGVTSAIAVPECAGIPVTHRG
ncbi:HemD protein, partial [Eggerthella lenta]|nr:HemD protein [Eggerthella lenta]